MSFFFSALHTSFYHLRHEYSQRPHLPTSRSRGGPPHAASTPNVPERLLRRLAQGGPPLHAQISAESIQYDRNKLNRHQKKYLDGQKNHYNHNNHNPNEGDEEQENREEEEEQMNSPSPYKVTIPGSRSHLHGSKKMKKGVVPEEEEEVNPYGTILGSMDRVESYLYFYDNEEFYVDKESAVYRDPNCSHLNAAAIHHLYCGEDYEHEKSAARGQSSSSSSSSSHEERREYREGDGGGDGRKSWRKCEHTRQDSPLAAHRKSRVHHSSNGTEGELPVPFESHTGAESDHLLFRQPSSGIHIPDVKPQESHHNENVLSSAGLFRSLVQDLEECCSLHANEPAIAWRTATRGSPLSDSNHRDNNNDNGNKSDNDRHNRSGGRMAYLMSKAAHLSHLVLNPLRKRVKTKEEGAKKKKNSQSEMLFMSPSRGLTYGELWNHIEALGTAFRDILKLQPGSLIGILDDTRMEWFVTCYAAWSQGIIVVILPDPCVCVECVALEMPELRLLHCRRNAIEAVRERYNYVNQQILLAETQKKEKNSSENPRHPGKIDHLGFEEDESIGMSSYVRTLKQPTLLKAGCARAGESFSIHCSQGESLLSPGIERRHQSSIYEREMRRSGRAGKISSSFAMGQERVDSNSSTNKMIRHVPKFIVTEPLSALHKDDAKTASDEAEGTEDAILSWQALLQKGEILLAARRSITQEAEENSHPTKLPHRRGEAFASTPKPTVNSVRSSQSNEKKRKVHTTSAERTSVVAPLRSTDLALVVYNGGNPKGVMLTHGNLKASVEGYKERLRGTPTGECSLFDSLTSSMVSSRHSSFDSLAERTNKELDLCNQDYWWRKWLPSGLIRFIATRSWDLLNFLLDMNLKSPIGFPLIRTKVDKSSFTKMHRAALESRSCYVAYLPLSHVFEFVCETVLLLSGFLIAYGSPESLLDGPLVLPHGDLTEFRPHILSAFPKNLDSICHTIQNRLTTSYTKFLYEAAFEARRLALRRGLDTPFLNSAVFRESNRLLGGRCIYILCTGAPLSARHQEYIQVACGVSVMQVYGLTESSSAGLLQRYWPTCFDNIGGPLGPIELKMRDCDEWVHFGTHFKSGELLMRGPSIMCGYFRRPEKTAEVLEESGWLHTGDIVELQPEDNSFRVICSITDEIKIATGVSIALESLEAIYSQHPLTIPGGVCILVHPYRSYITALILTDKSRCEQWLKESQGFTNLPMGVSATTDIHPERPAKAQSIESLPNSDSFYELQNDTKWPYYLNISSFNEAVTQSLNTHATHLSRRPFELLRAVRVLQDEWKRENGMKTATGALNRKAIAARYSNFVTELFADEF